MHHIPEAYGLDSDPHWKLGHDRLAAPRGQANRCLVTVDRRRAGKLTTLAYENAAFAFSLRREATRAKRFRYSGNGVFYWRIEPTRITHGSRFRGPCRVKSGAPPIVLRLVLTVRS